MTLFSNSVVKGSSLPALPPLSMLFIALDAVPTLNRGNTGDPLTKTAPDMIITTGSTTFTADDVPQYITCSGFTNSANNGTFPVVSVPAANQIRFTNSAGVAESGPNGRWQLQGRVQSLTDRINGIVATPPATVNSMVINNAIDASGKVLIGDIATAVAQNIEAVTAVASTFNGDTPCSFFTYAKRLVPGPSISGQIFNSARTHTVRAQFSSNQSMRMNRNNGSNDSATVTAAGIVDSTMLYWAWNWNATGPGTLNALKNLVSMGTDAPAFEINPTTLDRVTIGHITAVTNSGLMWRAWGCANYEMSIAQHTAVKAYVDAVYA